MTRSSTFEDMVKISQKCRKWHKWKNKQRNVTKMSKLYETRWCHEIVHIWRKLSTFTKTSKFHEKVEIRRNNRHFMNISTFDGSSAFPEKWTFSCKIVYFVRNDFFFMKFGLFPLKLHFLLFVKFSSFNFLVKIAPIIIN